MALIRSMADLLSRKSDSEKSIDSVVANGPVPGNVTAFHYVYEQKHRMGDTAGIEIDSLYARRLRDFTDVELAEMREKKRREQFHDLLNRYRLLGQNIETLKNQLIARLDHRVALLVPLKELHDKDQELASEARAENKTYKSMMDDRQHQDFHQLEQDVQTLQEQQEELEQLEADYNDLSLDSRDLENGSVSVNAAEAQLNNLNTRFKTLKKGLSFARNGLVNRLQQGYSSFASYIAGLTSGAAAAAAGAADDDDDQRDDDLDDEYEPEDGPDMQMGGMGSADAAPASTNSDGKKKKKPDEDDPEKPEADLR